MDTSYKAVFPFNVIFAKKKKKKKFALKPLVKLKPILANLVFGPSKWWSVLQERFKKCVFVDVDVVLVFLKEPKCIGIMVKIKTLHNNKQKNSTNLNIRNYGT